MTRIPEPCLDGQCRSPVACGGWGYCRERNAPLRGAPSEDQVERFREIARSRATEDVLRKARAM